MSKARRYVYDPSSEKGYRVQKDNFKENRKNWASTSVKKGVQNKKEIILEKLNKHLMSCKSVPELQLKLSKDNVEMVARYDKSDKLTGVSFRYNGLSIKASTFGKNFKASRIEQKLKENMQESNLNNKAITSLVHQTAFILEREEDYQKQSKYEIEIKKNVLEILDYDDVYDVADFESELSFVNLELVEKNNEIYFSDPKGNMVVVKYFSDCENSKNFGIITKIKNAESLNELQHKKGLRL